MPISSLKIHKNIPLPKHKGSHVSKPSKWGILHNLKKGECIIVDVPDFVNTFGAISGIAVIYNKKYDYKRVFRGRKIDDKRGGVWRIK